jgi:hypothetical protein
LCGLRRLTRNGSQSPLIETVTIDFTSSAAPDDSPGPAKSDSAQASVSTAVLTKPCAPDCGTCAFVFSNFNRQRPAAALAYADRPRPPCGVGPGDVHKRLTKTLNPLCRQGTPRGPPAFSS